MRVCGRSVSPCYCELIMPAPTPANPAVPRTSSELSEFLLRACHDLRGPIRTIRAHAELLARNRGEGEAEPSLGFIMSGVVGADALLEGLTDYSLALDIEPSSFLLVPMEVMLRSVLAKLASRIRENNAEINYSQLPKVSGNPDRLMQLWEYLLDYALRQRCADRPQISISAERNAEGWLFQFGHNGAGIDSDYLERIFTPFERVHPNQRPGPGMATCRVIVERHGGKIWAESSAPSGATFYFTLPE